MADSVLLIDDDPALLSSIGDFLDRSGYEVFREATGENGLEVYEQERPDVVVLDLGLPDVPGLEVLERLRTFQAAVLLLTGHGDVATAVKAMQLGAENFLTKPIDMPHLVAAISRAMEKVRLRREVDLLKTRVAPGSNLEALGASPVMQEIARQVQLLAESDRTTLLITGESGTGKGWAARLIHELSPRSRAPFVDVNCAGLTSTFLDSELFGHEKGAFTDAREMKQGLFEIADSGTLFLDEIGEVATELQPKLLKGLEERRFRRLGGTREYAVDVRVIAATNKDIDEAVASGAFREDLYYRITVATIRLPAVRERGREDRLALLRRLLQSLTAESRRTAVEIAPEALEVLLSYAWPGNVREMRNALERALILSRGAPVIALEHLPGEMRRGGPADRRRQALRLDDVERRHIERTLRHYKGNRTHTARELGISRATLIKKIKSYGLDT